MRTINNVLFAVVVGGLILGVAAPALAVDFVVNSTGQEADCNLDDGVCIAESSMGSGECGSACTVVAAIWCSLRSPVARMSSWATSQPPAEPEPGVVLRG